MTTTATYRKTKTGQWVAFGPASLIKPGPVVITKRSGQTKTEIVASVGRPFTVNGQAMVYGYLAETAPARRTTRRNSAVYNPDRCYYGHTSPHRGCPDCFDTFDN